MLHRSTIQLLRFHFSVFLMPVFWFALSQAPQVHTANAVLIFCILHLLVYPASNGYNSYMDRDTESVGGIKNPMQPTRQLFYVTIIMDVLAIALSLFISWITAALIAAYILASRAYSFRGIRLKRFAIPGYLTVVIFQGAVTFFIVYHAADSLQPLMTDWEPLLASSLLIGGFYPLTQIYQHEADKADGVTTISYLLGYTGTFVFCIIIYSAAMILLAWYFFATLQEKEFFVLQIFLLPVAVYFLMWFNKVRKNNSAANFVNTMRMNIAASVCTNLAFMAILVMKAV
jgi:1,4-dihydroxy-2-naphthoate polyprenyltransferase